MNDSVQGPQPRSAVGRVTISQEDADEKAPMGLIVRVVIYLVGVHFIAGFLYLLFYLGGAK